MGRYEASRRALAAPGLRRGVMVPLLKSAAT
jgi:hypothetical protein